jgi:hypothetical protein
MKLTIRPLTPDLWPALEDLFGENGAAGGCWCMAEIASAIETPWDMSMGDLAFPSTRGGRQKGKRG